MRNVIRRIWKWICLTPVDGDQLLRQARLDRCGDQEVLVYDRKLSVDESAALREAWERRYKGPA